MTKPRSTMFTLPLRRSEANATMRYFVPHIFQYKKYGIKKDKIYDLD